MIHCIQRAFLSIACLVVLCPQSAFAYTGTEQAQTSAPQSAPAVKGGAPKLLTAVRVFKPTATAMDIAPDGVLGALKKLLDKIEDIDAPLIAACLKQQCFVAGTMVATVTGAVAIENIEPGMAVLSAPEESGDRVEARPVLEVFQSVTTRLVTVHYDHDGDPETAEAALKATPGHPFFVPRLGGFIEADELQSGDELLLASGEKAIVTSVTTRSGVRVPVYNFAVAEFQTYFAGPGGVWVHNLCDEFLENLYALYKAEIGAGTMTPARRRELLTPLRETPADNIPATDLQRTQTGAAFFEADPNVIGENVTGDIDLCNDLLDETGLRIVDPDAVPQPVSVVRQGNGGQPFFASPKKRMPKEWAAWGDELAEMVSSRSAKISAGHSEGLALMRMKKELGSLDGLDIDLATAGQHICGHCINPDAAGLAEIAQVLGIRKLTIRSGDGFQDPRITGSIVEIIDGVLQ